MQRSKFLRVMGSFAAVAASFPLAGCGGGGGSDGTTDPTPAPLQPAPVPVPVVRTFAYIANYESADISIYEISDAGAMTSVRTVPSGAARAVAIHPSGKFAYAVNADEDISSYALDAKTGLLTPSQSPSLAAPGTATIEIHPSGKFAYATNYIDGSLSIYTVDPETGVLDMDASFPLGSTPLSIAIHPSGSFLFVGLIDNRILSFSVDTTTGGLTLRSTVTEERDAVGLVVSPSGKFLYIAAVETNISTRSVNELGELGPAIPVYAAGVRSISIDASGRYICAVTGVLDQNVSIYTVQDPETGVPTFMTTSASLGPGTLNSAVINPSGRFVYAIMSNQDGDLGTVTAFEIDQGAGDLIAMTPSYATGIDPVGIRVVSISN